MANIPSFGRTQSVKIKKLLSVTQLLWNCVIAHVWPSTKQRVTLPYGGQFLSLKKLTEASVLVGCETTTTFFTNSVLPNHCPVC
jgi:hypothetical protein